MSTRQRSSGTAATERLPARPPAAAPPRPTMPAGSAGAEVAPPGPADRTSTDRPRDAPARESAVREAAIGDGVPSPRPVPPVPGGTGHEDLLLGTVARRRLTRTGLGAVALGMVTGALLGLLLGLLRPATVTATAALDVAPASLPTLQSLQGTPPDEQLVTEHVVRQLAVLQGSELRTVVEQRLGRDDVGLTVSRSGQTAVIELAATAPDPATAVAVARTALTVYGELVADQDSELLARRLATIDGAIADLTRGGPGDPSDQARLDSLRDLRLEAQLQSDSGPVQVVGALAVDPTAGGSPLLLAAAGGAVLGGIALGGVVMGRQALSSRVGTGLDLRPHVDRVSVTEIPVGPGARPDPERARLLLAEIIPRPSGTIVVAGLPGTGVAAGDATTVATELAAAAAERGPTVLVHRAGTTGTMEPAGTAQPVGTAEPDAAAHPRPAVVTLAADEDLDLFSGRLAELVAGTGLSGPAVVVAATPLARSPRLLASLAAAENTVVVARAGADRLDARAAALLAALRRSGACTVGVVTRARWR
ncbi:hypothetical protein [Pseudonocardia alni]|uniref:hypothetical protein n=1 Tax=Pseudonocardia alni TaxID=33907 RepID=UPI0033D097B8